MYSRGQKESRQILATPPLHLNDKAPTKLLITPMQNSQVRGISLKFSSIFENHIVSYRLCSAARKFNLSTFFCPRLYEAAGMLFAEVDLRHE
jgi:hypothetical protein